MNTVEQSRLSIPQLRADLAGPVLSPNDAGYSAARRVFLLRSTAAPQPSCRRPVDADDVSLVVSLARETGLELAVRGGGHSNAGYGTSEGAVKSSISPDSPGSSSTPPVEPCARQAASLWARWPPRRRRTASQSVSATRLRWGSVGSRSAVASATSRASTG